MMKITATAETPESVVELVPSPTAVDMVVDVIVVVGPAPVEATVLRPCSVITVIVQE